jgi:hypothetical protein
MKKISRCAQKNGSCVMKTRGLIFLESRRIPTFSASRSHHTMVAALQRLASFYTFVDGWEDLNHRQGPYPTRTTVDYAG